MEPIWWFERKDSGEERFGEGTQAEGMSWLGSHEGRLGEE